jgi:hypothetical protein
MCTMFKITFTHVFSSLTVKKTFERDADSGMFCCSCGKTFPYSVSFSRHIRAKKCVAPAESDPAQEIHSFGNALTQMASILLPMIMKILAPAGNDIVRSPALLNCGVIFNKKMTAFICYHCNMVIGNHDDHSDAAGIVAHAKKFHKVSKEQELGLVVDVRTLAGQYPMVAFPVGVVIPTATLQQPVQGIRPLEGHQCCACNTYFCVSEEVMKKHCKDCIRRNALPAPDCKYKPCLVQCLRKGLSTRYFGVLRMEREGTNLAPAVANTLARLSGFLTSEINEVEINARNEDAFAQRIGWNRLLMNLDADRSALINIVATPRQDEPTLSVIDKAWLLMLFKWEADVDKAHPSTLKQLQSKRSVNSEFLV